ncbi:MAG TPA: type III pantothenate kinase [Steroidobacteraceae bacterium]
MAVLLVDIGNTRIKWTRLHGARLGRSQAAVHSAWSSATYDQRLFGRGAHPTSVWVTSVAGPRVNRALAAAARRAGVTARFVTVPRSDGGVMVGYLEPWRLGSDRFVAAVGAHELFPRMPVCVVGIGTAMTVDLLGGDGRHHGGVIIPGPALMVDTLLTRTHGIQRRARGGRASGASRLFARSTRAGLEQGARYAAAALIDRAVEEAQTLLGRAPLVVLTGGQAATVRPLLRSSCAVVPDLVLRGLEVLVRRAAASRR